MTDPKRTRLLELDARGKPTFAYRRAAETNLKATFDRVRRQLKAEAEAAKAPANVKQLRKAAK